MPRPRSYLPDTDTRLPQSAALPIMLLLVLVTGVFLLIHGLN